MNKQIKIILLGNGGVGKSSLVSACQRHTYYFNSIRAPFASVDSTIGIGVYDSNVLAIDTTVDYQLWDFAGQLEYATIHQVICSALSLNFATCDSTFLILMIQHFLSDSDTLYIIVLSLARELSIQLEYWLEFLTSQLPAAPKYLLVVGTKSDLLKKPLLEERQNELQQITRQHKLSPPILVSAATLTNVSLMKTSITQIVNQLGSSTQTIPSEYLFMKERIKSDKRLVFQSTIKSNILSFLHNIGEIVFDKRRGNEIGVTLIRTLILKLMYFKGMCARIL